MLNKCIMIGRLTAEPELRVTPKGKSVANFTLAIDRPFFGGDGEKKADFFRVVVWNTPAEKCAEYLDKGSLVAVVGSMQNSNYEDKDGNKRYQTNLVAETVRFLESKRQRADRAESDSGEKKWNENKGSFESGYEFAEEDCPF